MGMPITAYNVLRVLAYPEKSESYEIKAGRKALEPFNCFAFIIHDPQEHATFHHALTSQFDRLDYVTGAKLLFFALIEAPPEWRLHAASREYYQHITSREARELLKNNKIRSKDPTLTAFALAHGLNIPQEALPVIVVADTFAVIRREGSQVQWFRTCPEHLETQLAKLGYLAARQLPFKPEEFDLCGGYGEETIGNLAKVLANILSASASTSIRDADWILKTWHLELNKMKLQDQDDRADIIEKLSIQIAVHVAQIAKNDAKRSGLPSEPFISIRKEYLENPSYQILKTAQIVSSVLGTANSPSNNAYYDYAPAIICLAKVFEREINLSVVHWARKELGVELPQYFNQYQPGVKAQLSTGPSGEFVDFNMKSRRQWLPPGIGQSEFGCKELGFSRGLPPDWEPQAWSELFTDWNTIRRERNKAAHTEIMDQTSFSNMQTTLNHLAQRGMFEKFHRMKFRYKGDI